MAGGRAGGMGRAAPVPHVRAGLAGQVARGWGGRVWLARGPEDVEGGMVFCRPVPATARRLREVDRAATLRGFCLARLEDHLGKLEEKSARCRKVGCGRKRIGAT